MTAYNAKLIRKLRLFLLDLLYPARCEICGRFVSYDENICRDCQNSLKTYTGFCQKCGFTKCRCKEKTLSYDGAFSLWVYEGAARRAVLNLKERDCSGICDMFASAVRERFKEDKFDAVCFVPMTKERKKVYGFNQAEIIADAVGKKLSVPIIKDALIKTKNYSHHELSRKERETAVANAFCVKNTKSLKGKNILLCDDIMTTGSTMNECAGVLKTAGAKSVTVISIANAEGGDNDR